MSALEPAADPAAALDALQCALSDPTVRDLAWLLLSPSLLRAQPPAGELADPFETPDEAAATVAWLLRLDRDASPLRQAIASTPIARLGRYAECLLGFFLQHGPAARLVAANVALRLAGRTIGECDFLVETASGRRLHWELAVKCYLHAGGERAELADYVGPNLQDRFDLKLAHLLVFGSACLLTVTAAQAQWQWVDQNNKKVFSDTAPPPDIPEKYILRRPGPAA